MKINTTFTSKLDCAEIQATYYDQEDLKELTGKKIHSVHAFCFYQNKLVIVYCENKGYWHPIGGGVEAGETYEEAVIREVQEESNMKVMEQQLIAFQDSIHPDKPDDVITQTRSVCLVEPYGDFVSDPDGDVTEIKLIDPKDYKQYFDWGEVGERLMRQVLEVLRDLYADNS